MTHFRLLRAMGLAVAGVALAGSVLRAAQAPDLAVLLDEYTSSGGERAIRRIEQLDDEAAIEMRLDWATVGRAWIDRDPANRPRRVFAAAVFALETEAIRVERGQWARSASRKIKENGKERTIRCNGACVLSWARGLFIERGAPDKAEHVWWMATIALAQGVRDTRFLLPPAPVSVSPAFMAAARFDPNQIPRDTTPGHLDAALIRFPNDADVRLARAVAVAARYDITTAAGPRSPGVSSGLRDLPAIVSEFEAIADDSAVPVGVRTEARIRLGYLHWAMGDNRRALAALKLAAESAPDAELRYLALYLSGTVLESGADNTGAMKSYEAALEARPHSQSASIKLAALRQLNGDAAGAQVIAQESLDARPIDADPWRLFLYGSHPKFPALMADVRRQVSR